MWHPRCDRHPARTLALASHVLDAHVLAAARAVVQAEALQQALVAASTAPLFLADIHAVLQDFDAVDTEGWEAEA